MEWNCFLYEGGRKVNRLKSSYDDVISAVDDFFDQWDPSIVTLMEEVCGLQGNNIEK